MSQFSMMMTDVNGEPVQRRNLRRRNTTPALRRRPDITTPATLRRAPRLVEPTPDAGIDVFPAGTPIAPTPTPVTGLVQSGLGSLNQFARTAQALPQTAANVMQAGQTLAQPTPGMAFNLQRALMRQNVQNQMATNPPVAPTTEQIVAGMNPAQQAVHFDQQRQIQDSQRRSEFDRQDTADIHNRMNLARMARTGTPIDASTVTPQQAQQLRRAGANMDFSAFRTPGVRAPGRGFAGGGLVSQPFNQTTLAPSTETAEQLAARRQAIRDYRSTVRPQDRGRVSFGDFRRQQAQDQLRMDLARQQARPEPVTVSAGESVVDPNTGRVVFQAPAQPRDTRPVTVSPGQTVVNPSTGEVVFEAPQQVDRLTEAKIRELESRGSISEPQRIRLNALREAMRNAFDDKDRGAIMAQINAILAESEGGAPVQVQGTPASLGGAINNAWQSAQQRASQQQGTPIDAETARSILMEARGDRDRARQIARERGFIF